MWEATKAAVGDSAKVIAGAGNYNTAESVELSRQAVRVGADAILATVPYYSKPPQSGLEKHFRAIADAVDLPVLLYNIPGRTSVNMSAETTVKLSRVPNIMGVKEASGNLEQIGRICRETDDDFFVWSGDDAATLPIVALGGYGVVSVASHLVGRQIARMIDCAVEGVPVEAAALHHQLMPLFGALFPPTSSSPIPLKYALKQVGFDCGPLRLPLDEIDAKSAAGVDAALAQIKIDLSPTEL
jgi:4-hydroxy-tetrahydrodipicolinate synthase